MKNNTLVIIFCLLYSLSYPQKFQGSYETGPYKIKFLPGNLIYFDLVSQGCDVSFFRGKGNYIIKDSFIHIFTKHYDELYDSNYKIIKTNEDTTITNIHVIRNSVYYILKEHGNIDSTISSKHIIINDYNQDVACRVIWFLDKNKQIIKDINKTLTDINGKTSIQIYKRVIFLEVKEQDLTPTIIPVKYIKGKDVEIIMNDRVLVEDKELIFVIKSLNKDQFELKSTDCNICGNTRKMIFTKKE